MAGWNIDLDKLATKLVETAGAGYTAKQSVKQAEAIAEQQKWIAADNSDPSLKDGVYEAAGQGGDSTKTLLIVGGVALALVLVFIAVRK